MSTHGSFNWQATFDDGPLSRGVSYYKHGLVDDLHHDEDGWHATVRGSWDYDVHVEVDKDGNPNPDGISTSCSCPYFASAGPCKHIAATCLAIEEANTDMATSTDEPAPWEDLLKSVSWEDCIAFLRDTLSREPQFRREFVARFGEPNVEAARRSIAASIDSALYTYGDGYGYVDWHNSFAFESDVCDAIRLAVRPYLDRKAWQESFDVSLAALAELRTVEVDGSDGFYSTAADTCFGIWRDIINRGGDAGADVVAKGIPAFLATEEGDEDDYDVFSCQQSDAVGFFLDAFQDDPRHAQEVYAWCDATMRDNAWRWIWNGEKLVVISGMHALRAMGRSLDERMDFARPQLSCLAVRLEVANELVAEKRLGEAVDVLRDGLATCEKPNDILDLHKALLDCFELQGDHGAAATCLEELLRRTGNSQEAISWWRRLRELVGEEAWDAKSNEILAHLQVSSVRYALLAEEGRLSELMDEIERRKSIAELMHYDRLLAKDYPQRVIRLYHNKVMTDLDRACSRNGYRAALMYLERMGTLPGTERAFVDTADLIRATYPRRPALHDELRKIGG